MEVGFCPNADNPEILGREGDVVHTSLPGLEEVWNEGGRKGNPRRAKELELTHKRH